MTRHFLLGVVIAVLLLGGVVWWLGDDKFPEYGRWSMTGSGVRTVSNINSGPLSLERIVDRLDGLPEGSRLLEVERHAEGRRLLLEIEFVTTDGRILEWWVDAITGKILAGGIEH